MTTLTTAEECVLSFLKMAPEKAYSMVELAERVQRAFPSEIPDFATVRSAVHRLIDSEHLAIHNVWKVEIRYPNK